jgi:hypothetical protein
VGELAMTFLQLQNKVLALMDESGDTGTVLENTKTFLNSALKNRCLEKKWPFMLSDETTLSVTAGTNEATLPADFNTMHWVKNSENRLMRQMPLVQRFQDSTLDADSLQSSNTGDYVIYGTTIKFTSLASSHSGTNYTIQYYRYPEDLVDDTDEPDFPAQFHDLLVWDAVIGLKGYHAELDNIEYLLEQQRRAEQRLYVSNFSSDSVGQVVSQVRWNPNL